MMNNKVSFTNSNNPTISLSAVIYFPPKFDETLVRSILVRCSVMVGKTM